jgi:hypothetical protein
MDIVFLLWVFSYVFMAKLLCILSNYFECKENDEYFEKGEV